MKIIIKIKATTRLQNQENCNYEDGPNVKMSPKIKTIPKMMTTL